MGASHRYNGPAAARCAPDDRDFYVVAAWLQMSGPELRRYGVICTQESLMAVQRRAAQEESAAIDAYSERYLKARSFLAVTCHNLPLPPVEDPGEGE